MKNFLLADSSELMAVRLISSPEPKNVWILLPNMIYVVFMKNFILADSSELMVVRLISAFSAKKRLIPTFFDMIYVELKKNFLLADSIELLVVRLISASWAQKRWFLLSAQGVRRVHEKFSSRRFQRADGC